MTSRTLGDLLEPLTIEAEIYMGLEKDAVRLDGEKYWEGGRGAPGRYGARSAEYIHVRRPVLRNEID